MQKVIVERPRWGSRMPNISSTLKLTATDILEPDDYDEGERPKRPVMRKMLNEHLGPLERYLHKQVGRPWDKVYAEIRQTIDTRSAVGLHVLQHIPDYVSIDGCSAWARLYVHPRTRLLRSRERRSSRTDWRARRADEADDNFVAVDENSSFEKLNGLWFRVTYGTAPARNEPRPVIAKHQLDRKTIKRVEAGELGTVTNKLYWNRVTNR